MKVLQFLAVVLTALALIPVGAHLFALPNKIDLDQTDYFIAQNIYRGWALLGIVLIGALLINLALAIMLRARGAPYLLVAINTLCLAITLAIFFAFTFPANQATSNWTAIPANWRALRFQWETSHAVNAGITFIGFCALTLSLVLRARK